MSRSVILLSATFILAIAGCGDDSETSNGGASSSAATGTTSGPTTGTPSSSSTSSSSDGGSTSDGGGGSTSDGGAPGVGGQGGAGEGGTSGVGGNATFEEACEDLNDTYEDIANDLDCFVEPGVCDEPAQCADENRAVIDCLRQSVVPETDCLCQAKNDTLLCITPDCDDEFQAVYDCEDAL